jgi:hypothetical protein
VARSIRVFAFVVLALSAWSGVVARAANADVCASTTDSQHTVGKVCVTSITPQGGTAVSPQPGVPVTVIGNTRVTATVTYSPAALPAGEVRGCAGQRLTPSGCLSWLVDGGYTLTQLYSTSGVQGNRTYSWTWGTSQYQNTAAGKTRTLAAQIQLDGAVVSANVPVVIANAVPGSFPSPIQNNGLLPIFSQSTPFTVAAFGDGPSGSPQTQYVANLVHSWNPNMLMYLGDVYQRGMPDEFANFYNPIYGSDAPITAPTVGNHEYKQLTNGQGYFWYWNFPNGSPTRSGGGGSWYSLNAGDWHIISLNSNVGMSLNPPTPQGLWLKQDLAADLAARPKAGDPCTLAFWHAPRFSDISLRKPSTVAFWNQLYPYGADIIINAHSHVYERWQPLNNSGQVTTQASGMTQFVVGTGGNVLAQQWNTNDSRSAIRENTHWGALKLTLYPDHAAYQFWEVNGSNPANATLFDAGTVNCRNTGTPTTLTLHASSSHIVYGQGSTLIAHLTGAPVGSNVTITRNIAGVTSTVTTRAVDAGHNVTVVVKPGQHTVYSARYAGATGYGPSASGAVSVTVSPVLGGTMSEPYASSQGYRLYHYRASCASSATSCPVFTATFKPASPGQVVQVIMQQRSTNGWRKVATFSGKLGSRSTAVIKVRYRTTALIGRQLRLLAHYAATSKFAAANKGYWYFKITH